jgi:hypothetical protein
MTRKHFLKLIALALGGALMPLDAIQTDRRRASAFFVGHGSPMIGIEENNFTRSLMQLGKTLEEPKAILVVSAHWTPPFFGVSVHHSPALMYDFFGFPEPLYQVRYPAPNAEFLTPTMQEIFTDLQVRERSLDHGAWTVLKHLYQLRDPNTFNQLSDDTEGIYKLLECDLFDASVATAKRLIVHPGQDVTVTLDRAEGAKYVALAAGYYALEKDRMIRLFDIPVVIDTKGFIKRTKESKPGRLAIELELGPSQISREK